MSVRHDSCANGDVVGMHNRQRELTEFLTIEGSSLIEIHEMYEKHADENAIDVRSVRSGVCCLKSSEEDTADNLLCG